ncbi:hypothetical protein C7B65_23115 [Phormidesmis priestleyi ULC007]|uniref:Uncharacterized protein n=1 Tax=Phormidesmis priestleyi ULC007 TaxID=1920490 RepID=A0A2T1D669_9CYAN|nr:hypothetical protein [Phormidesmis priestleyi]PSB15947.1 hypothetical protein C7B65_23115 [Phormidesmis priestleyi ULC007]PZO49836.1 MAG: hypothetical protein DCF14_13555 [Phormidesmis priestleyi]
MGGLIKLIKNFFSGIFSFLGGLVGGKKSIEGSAPKTRKGSGYFLEMDEAEAEKKPAVSASATESSPKPVATTSEAAPTSKQSSKRAELLAAAASSNGSAPVAQKPVEEKAPVAVAPKPEASAEFATKYLVPTSNGTRRRPGANMNSYLDMARGMKSN